MALRVVYTNPFGGSSLTDYMMILRTLIAKKLGADLLREMPIKEIVGADSPRFTRLEKFAA